MASADITLPLFIKAVSKINKTCNACTAAFYAIVGFPWLFSFYFFFKQTSYNRFPIGIEVPFAIENETWLHKIVKYTSQIGKFACNLKFS